ncbi:MAG: hypothetical protein HY736_10095 [Verrucomicrobia bacterium]|nr:hypothetical protein [Verrucomicrobiota bacterium]
MSSLHEHLWNLNAEMQKSWLRQVDAWDKTLTRKAQFVAAIETHLRDNLASFVARLSDAEKHLLAESAHQGCLIGPREFEAKFGGPCPMPKGYYGYREEVSLLTAVICLPRYANEGEPELAGELVEPLRRLLPKPETPRPRTLAALPKFWPSEKQFLGGDKIRPVHVHEGERIAPAELARVLRLIQGGKLQVADSSRRPTDAATRLIGEALLVPDFALEPPKKEIDKWTELGGPVRAHAWGALVQQCGWARPRGGALTLTADGQAMLRGFSPEAFRAGVMTFLGDGEFDELHRVNHIRGQSGKGRRWLRNPGLRKAAIQEAMNALPVGDWLTYEEARRIIEASGQEWDVLKEDAGVLYFAELRYGVINDMGGLNSQFLRTLFLESFATLGLLDVGYVHPQGLWPDLGDSWGIDDLSFCGRYDGLLYVRINPLGAYALGYADRYDFRADPGPKLLHLLPNLEIHLATGVLNPADRASLELMAVLQDNGVWMLDAERILSHVEAGGTLAELQQFLETNADDGLPESVRDFVGSLDHRIGAFRRARDAVLLEWENEGLARHIADDVATSALCHHAGGNRLVVPKDHLAAFRRALKKLGFVMPAGK